MHEGRRKEMNKRECFCKKHSTRNNLVSLISHIFFQIVNTISFDTIKNTQNDTDKRDVCRQRVTLTVCTHQLWEEKFLRLIGSPQGGVRRQGQIAFRVYQTLLLLFGIRATQQHQHSHCKRTRVTIHYTAPHSHL